MRKKVKMTEEAVQRIERTTKDKKFVERAKKSVEKSKK